VLCHQFIGQIAESRLHEAVLGNCGAVVSFRVGAEDAPRLSQALDAPASELATLSRGHACIRTLRDGQPTVARPIEIEMATLGAGHLAAAIANTHANFVRPRKLAERRPAPRRHEWQ
jgi:hypothetical protein